MDYQAELPRLKTSTRSQISIGDFYGETEIAKINDWFGFGFDRFGYDRTPEFS